MGWEEHTVWRKIGDLKRKQCVVRTDLHALSDAFHLPRSCDSLCSLMRFLQLPLLVLDAPQQALHTPLYSVMVMWTFSLVCSIL